MSEEAAVPAKRDRAGVIAPPPLIFAAIFFLGWFGRGFLPRYQSIIGGAVPRLLAAAILAWGATTCPPAPPHFGPFQPPPPPPTTRPRCFSPTPPYLCLRLGSI